MNILSVKQTVARGFVAAGLAAAALASPIIWSMNTGPEVARPGSGTVVKADSGLDQLQWIYDVQPHAQAHVDTTVHQSR
jgi:hypothetical protein